jgi:hypothetical protein
MRSDLKTKMQVRPDQHFVNRATSRAHIQQQQQNWPAYFCKDCNAAIVPKHNEPIMEGSTNHLVPQPGLDDDGDRRAPKRVGTTVKVTVVKPTGRRETHYGWHPEHLAAKMCPSCYDKHDFGSKNEASDKVSAKQMLGQLMLQVKQVAARRKESDRDVRRVQRSSERVQKQRGGKVRKSAALWLVL